MQVHKFFIMPDSSAYARQGRFVFEHEVEQEDFNECCASQKINDLTSGCNHVFVEI